MKIESWRHQKSRKEVTRKTNLRIGMKNTRKKKEKESQENWGKKKERDGIRDREKERISARRTIQKLS